MNTRPAGVIPLLAARGSWVSGTRSTGVCPQGAHGRTASGNQYQPDCSTQTTVRPSAAGFFPGWPALAPPRGAGGRVALGGARARVLDALADGMPQPTDVGGMGGDAKRAADDGGDPPAGPDRAAEAVGLCPALPQGGELGQLRGGELGGRTGGGMAPQGRYALLVPALEPLADRSRRHPPCGGAVLLFPTRFLQLPGAAPPSFAPVELRGLLRAHGRRVSRLYPSMQRSVIRTPSSARRRLPRRRAPRSHALRYRSSLPPCLNTGNRRGFQIPPASGTCGITSHHLPTPNPLPVSVALCGVPT
jgi:hypothetical protein